VRATGTSWAAPAPPPDSISDERDAQII